MNFYGGEIGGYIYAGTALALRKERGVTRVSFKTVQNKIANKSGVSKKSAGAILANASRKASPAAKAKNPKLKRVK